MKTHLVALMLAFCTVTFAQTPSVPKTPSGPYTFSLSQTPLHQVVRILYGEILKEPFLLDDVVKNNAVSINFKNADSEALRDVLDSYLLSKGVQRRVERGVNLFVVADKPTAQASPTQSIQLHQAEPIQDVAAQPGQNLFDKLTEHAKPVDGPQLSSGDEVLLYKPRHRHSTELLKVAQQVAGQGHQVGDDLLLIGNSHRLSVTRLILDQFDTPAGEVVMRATVAEYTTSADDGAGLFGTLKGLSSKLQLSIGDAKTLTNFLSFKNSTIEAVVSAFATDSRFTVVDSSTIRVVSGKSGRLSIGQEVPVLASFTQTQTGQAVQNISYRSAGLQLEVKPVVVGNRVQAEVTQIVSSFAVTKTSNIDSPTLLKREFTSNLGAEFGEVIVLGGLDEDKATEAQNGLFGMTLGRNNSKSRSSLFLVLQFQKV